MKIGITTQPYVTFQIENGEKKKNNKLKAKY